MRWAVEDVSGGLASHADSDYASADFRRIAADLAAAQAGNHALPGMSIDYHLLYLLEAASQPHTRLVEPTYVAARERGFTEGDSQMGWVCDAVEMLAGSRPLSEGTTCSDAATSVRGYLAVAVGGAPGNWRTAFEALISP